MSITLKKVCKSYDSHTVLAEVTASLNVGEKIALVGENGAGKTTFLKLCAGVEEASAGTITRDEYMLACFVPQEFPLEKYDGLTGREYVYLFGKDNLLRSVDRLLGKFDVDVSILDKHLSLLSGGQQKILDLCTCLAQRPQYLLIDEPENHLDIFSRQVLIDMIRHYRGCVVFVSHDQEMINAITNRILEIEGGTIKSYTGSYEFYLEHKARMEEGQLRTWKAHEKKVNQLDKLIKRMHEWCQKNPDLGAQLSARKTQLRKLQERAPEKPKIQRQATFKLKEVEQNRTKVMLRSQGLTIRLGGADILRDTDVSLFFGEKVALIGRNGSGKSTFLKAVLGQIPVAAGDLRLGVNIKIGYFSQEAVTTLNLEETPFDVVARILKSAEQHHVRSLLAQYLIGADTCMRKIGTLSGGEKTRLRFCLLFAANNDLILLDEPTNHLDPISWEILAEALKTYQGTVLMVSHDRMFIDQVAEKLWMIKDSKIVRYYGSLSEYLLEGSN